MCNTVFLKFSESVFTQNILLPQLIFKAILALKGTQAFHVDKYDTKIKGLEHQDKGSTVQISYTMQHSFSK